MITIGLPRVMEIMAKKRIWTTITRNTMRKRTSINPTRVTKKKAKKVTIMTMAEVRNTVRKTATAIAAGKAGMAGGIRIAMKAGTEMRMGMKEAAAAREAGEEDLPVWTAT